MSIPCATMASSISCFNIPTSVPSNFLRGDLYLQIIITLTFTETASVLYYLGLRIFYPLSNLFLELSETVKN